MGSGAGLPGIPLAILNPEKQFTLLDSNGKDQRLSFKTNRLALTNVKEVNCRVEAYQPETPFDMVITRAFSSLPKCFNSVIIWFPARVFFGNERKKT